MKFTLAIFGTLLILTLASCSFRSVNKPIANNNPEFALGVINGKPVDKGDALTKSTVGLFNNNSDYICTGTYIGNNLVLTAAHCVDDADASDLIVIFHPDMNNILDTENQETKNLYTRKVAAFEFNKLWIDSQKEDKPFDRGDIALVKFQGELPEGFSAAEFLTDQSQLKLNSHVVVAGYGVSLVESEEVTPKKNQKFQKMLKSGEVVCDGDQKMCLRIRMSGDGLLRRGSAPISRLYSSEVVLNENNATGTCSGDSGGPAFIEQNGKLLFFGITSRGSLLCNDVGLYTNAIYYKDWITETSKNL